ncbi:hypothetical protein V8C40DRAFT_243004 [Trichoderma camerunense]
MRTLKPQNSCSTPAQMPKAAPATDSPITDTLPRPSSPLQRLRETVTQDNRRADLVIISPHLCCCTAGPCVDSAVEQDFFQFHQHSFHYI